MVKIVVAIIIAIIAVAYFNDPDSFKPWREVSDHASKVVAKAVKDSGEATNNFIRDESHRDGVIVKNAVLDADNSVKQAVTGKLMQAGDPER